MLWEGEESFFFLSNREREESEVSKYELCACEEISDIYTTI